MDLGDGHGDGERGAWGCPYIFGLHLLAPSVAPLAAYMTQGQGREWVDRLCACGKMGGQCGASPEDWPCLSLWLLGN